MNDLIPIRLSHLLRHCSVGAIVRGPNALMTVMDTRHWTDQRGKDAGRPLRYVERVRAALQIDQELREPPIAHEGAYRRVEGVCIPARKFPGWGICPRCGLLHFLPALRGSGDTPRCQETDKQKCPPRPGLEQVTYILVHADGHMDDVPWHFLTHLNARGLTQSQCRPDTRRHYLYLRPDKEGRSKLNLYCAKCKAQTVFNPFDLKQAIKSMRRQPWLNERVELEGPPEILKVNQIQIHFPLTRNALVIPPESRIRKGTVVDRLYTSAEKRRWMESCRTALQWKSAVRRIATEFRCGTEAIEKAWQQIKEGYPLFGEALDLTPGQLREDEYRALVEVIPDMTDDEDFVTRHRTEEWGRLTEKFDSDSMEGRLLRIIDRLVAIKRLKEIMVFEGFSRVHPGRQAVVKPDITGQSPWLPAVELFGEGLFITVDDAVLEAWEDHPQVMERAGILQKRYEKAPIFFADEPIRITPRFLLLHTFAHLLIRQLETDGGYPAASLKERIYYSRGEMQMAGILIYVAVPDIVGSLGGIMELADPARFLPLATAAIARAKWCSLDPVCSEHGGQGLYLLNRAACHACLLIPEPSCEYRNTLLDRVLVKGDGQKGLPGFFDAAPAGRGKFDGQT